MNIELKSAKTVYCPDKVFVRSLDHHYTYESRSNSFSLPRGKFYIQSKSRIKIRPLKKPDYSKYAERYFPHDWTFRVYYGNRPESRATIWPEDSTRTAVIVFDNSLRSLGYITRLFVFMHEVGHVYYRSSDYNDPKEAEKKCDIFAKNMMLSLGYNPSQIIQANLDSKNMRIHECLDMYKKFLLKKEDLL